MYPVVRLLPVLPLTLLVLLVPALPAQADPGDPGDPGEPVATSISLQGTTPRLVDERSGRLVVRWSDATGAPVAGTARVWFHARNRPWSAGNVVRTRPDGRLVLPIRPRVDTWYQVRGEAGPSWQAAVSPPFLVDNVPPAAPVVLPARAPRPTPLPAQQRAQGPGANVRVSGIPAPVWRRMVGRSWRPGCVARAQLRYLTVNYWGFDGYRHRGELVVRAAAVGKFTRALTRLYAGRHRIRAMYLPDRFGWSARSGGANDFASMRHDNTSAFNCRWVTGRPGVRSPHAGGRSLDLNPFENPFRSAVGWLPNRWWIHHSAPYAWRSRSHPVVRILRASGFRWSYPRSDPQHFDG